MKEYKRKDRQDNARNIGKALEVQDIQSFERGVKWADFNPDWKEDKPAYETNKYGLPKLYLVQGLSLDMTFGYRYTYRVAFIDKSGNWNVDYKGSFKVMRYMDIYCNESDSQMIQKDIPFFNEDLENEENNIA